MSSTQPLSDEIVTITDPPSTSANAAVTVPTVSSTTVSSVGAVVSGPLVFEAKRIFENAIGDPSDPLRLTYLGGHSRNLLGLFSALGMENLPNVPGPGAYASIALFRYGNTTDVRDALDTSNFEVFDESASPLAAVAVPTPATGADAGPLAAAERAAAEDDAELRLAARFRNKLAQQDLSFFGYTYQRFDSDEARRRIQDIFPEQMSLDEVPHVFPGDAQA